MIRPRARLVGSVVVGLLVASGIATPRAQDGSHREDGAGRIVAIGDIHGAYTSFVSILRLAGLLDDQGRWAGGQATLVQTGDILDRGAGVRPVMDLLMTLERQAEAAGGRVVVLLGNHETMNLTRLLQDTSPAAIATFADDRSERRRAEAHEQYRRFVADRRRELGQDPPGVLTEEQWMQAHPPGLIEYLEALSPDGVYGRWLRDKPIAAMVDGTLFVHGGLNPAFAESSVDRINRRARQEIERFDDTWEALLDRDVVLPFFTFYEVLEAARADLAAWVEAINAPLLPKSTTFRDERYLEQLVELLEIGDWSIVHTDGPLWFRGFATWSEEEGAPYIDELQERYDARRFVVAHTIAASHLIRPRFDDRVFLIDTGMLSEVYLNGQPSALEITGDVVKPLYLNGPAPASGPPSGEVGELVPGP